jgi:dihydroorotate dehydrogenase
MMLEEAAAAALRRLEPETAHRLTIAALSRRSAPKPAVPDPVLQTRLAGLTLHNPVGLAAGMDKNAEALGGLARLGFGFVEAGSVTPRPQPGNPRPRLFRLTEDRAVINRMGFNNDGLEAFAARLDRRPPGVLIGANLGANKDSEDRAADYVTGLRRLAGKADWFTVNVSSPNTPGLRALQGRDALDDLLGRVAEARPADGAPVFLKIAPDLEPGEIVEIVQAARVWKLDGLIVSNTTTARPAALRSPHAGETGGLSGAPLKPLARRALGLVAEAAEGRLALIAAGGIDSGEEALHRIRQGAGAVQLYSALVHQGPGLVRRILSDLRARLLAEGFTTISEAVGTGR